MLVSCCGCRIGLELSELRLDGCRDVGPWASDGKLVVKRTWNWYGTRNPASDGVLAGPRSSIAISASWRSPWLLHRKKSKAMLVKREEKKKGEIRMKRDQPGSTVCLE